MGEKNDDIKALTAEVQDLRRRVDDLSINVMILIVFVILVSMLVISLSGFNFISIIIVVAIFLMALVCLRSLEQHGL